MYERNHYSPIIIQHIPHYKKSQSLFVSVAMRVARLLPGTERMPTCFKTAVSLSRRAKQSNAPTLSYTITKAFSISFYFQTARPKAEQQSFHFNAFRDLVPPKPNLFSNINSVSPYFVSAFESKACPVDFTVLQAAKKSCLCVSNTRRPRQLSMRIV